MDTIAVFRSRNEALQLVKALNKMGISCTAINTPSSLNIGCGLSVVFSASVTSIVSAEINRLNLKYFKGFFDK